MTDQKFEDIETTLAFHDKTLAELSDMVNAQWLEIEKLKRQLSKANDKISELESSSGDHGGGDQANVRPPHY